MGGNIEMNPLYVGRVNMNSGAAPVAGANVFVFDHCVRCEIINSGGVNNLQVSFDNQVNWVTLAPTERILAVGKLYYLPRVRGVVGATTYECVYTYI